MSHPEPTTLTDVVVLLAAVFERLGIPYAFGGALATSFWGVPRTTQDADCLISVPAVEYQRLADALAAAGFLIDEPDGSRPIDVATLRRQVVERGYMNVIRGATPVELFVPLVPLQQDVLKRATPLPFAGRIVRITTAEDLILLKMAFHRQKDLLDIKGMLHVQRGRLDLDYVRRWSGRILEEDLAAELESMIAEYGGDESRDSASR
jgi:hypothetical protein